jgi:hypothetical protein
MRFRRWSQGPKVTNKNYKDSLIRSTLEESLNLQYRKMTIPRPRPLRSTTLLSGSSSYSQQPALKLSLRKSLNGHWTLIEPVTHKTFYHFCAQNDDSSTRELRRNSSDGALLATVSLKSSPTRRHLFFPNEQLNIELTSSFRDRPRFTIEGRKLYWKRDVVCRESRTRHVIADTDGDTILIYEGGEQFQDIIIATFLAMKLKRENSCSNSCPWLKVINPQTSD